MSEWTHCQLSDVCEFFIGGTPSRNQPEFWATPPNGSPWLAISDLKSKFLLGSKEHITELGALSSNVKLIPSDSTVMSFKLSIGRTGITKKPMYCNEAIAFFKPHEGELSSRWLYHSIPTAANRVVTDSAVKGATLNKKKIAEIPLHLPPLNEQVGVANVLDTLDIQIQKTEALIAKLEKVKEGLLHDLLTHGIDERGLLRPSPEQAPELYKESPLGLVPREWECGSLGELSTSSVIGPFGSDLVASDYRPEGVPVVFVRDVVSKTFTWKSEVYVDHLKAASLSAHDVIAGDVLLTKMGLPPCIACTYPSEFSEGIVTADIVRLRPDKSMVLPDWISNYANSEHVASQVRAITSGVTRPKVTLSDVRSLKVAVPPLKDQRAILLRVSEASRRVNAARTSLSKLLSEKSGLMDDLLTGRVRVTPLLEQAQASTPA
ncbi:restriction endonuclease subunit S [Billgrantia kenyensis]|uniref:Restriction endonuclease subunit S n=1 Tax=Billgrantia kenyensis TaxID=321266 RepID=A0A7W0AFG4_9GAMM|nr:restriction endonuclease subunit S [Halomonas kenyensis]MBA2780594.1 restriction endonuclease subunit S [Halomonas kenyensis]MCG6663287.1 restriction endonuclease subunit S [Halomonas kenyensis]